MIFYAGMDIGMGMDRTFSEPNPTCCYKEIMLKSIFTANVKKFTLLWHDSHDFGLFPTSIYYVLTIIYSLH